MLTPRSFTMLALILAACGPNQPATTEARGAPDQGALVLGGGGEVLALDPRTGSVLLREQAVPALGDWGTAFSSTIVGGRTTLEAIDVATGGTRVSVSLPGELEPRVASYDGSLVALMPPSDLAPWTAVPRAATPIVVADAAGGAEPRRFELEGSFEPEAFSTDRRSLYLISYVPPEAPTGYRVERLELASGRLRPVGTGKVDVVETMSGDRFEQVASEDGTMLYTLYLSRPAPGTRGTPTAFVHTLDLDDGWAICVGLPEEMSSGDPADQAIALSPDGDVLFAVDTGRGIVAAIDTEEYLVTSSDVDLNASAGEARAVVGPDGALYVADGPGVVRIDPATLRPAGGWTTVAPVTALGSGPDGLYVAIGGAVEVRDPATGARVFAVRSPAVDDAEYVGPLA